MNSLTVIPASAPRYKRLIVGVWVPNAVGADPLHDPAVIAPVGGEVAHVVVAGGVYHAMIPDTVWIFFVDFV